MFYLCYVFLFIKMKVFPYSADFAPEWDRFVAVSRNATFIHSRRFMDYHADRFPDASLIMCDDHDRVVALLPATHKDGLISSHAGLTYGGWLLGPSKPDVLQLLSGWDAMRKYYRKKKCHTLLYKAIPDIYHRYPSQEDLYALFRNDAVISSALISSVVDLHSPLSFDANARRHVRNGLSMGLKAAESDELGCFWEILTRRLLERYGAMPVHSLEEIRLLKSRFPENIVLWMAFDCSSNPLSGALFFIQNQVVKAQYIASNEEGLRVNALDFMFDAVIRHYAATPCRYLDLGPSCEDAGRTLNEGLVRQKIGYGGRGVTYFTYKTML